MSETFWEPEVEEETQPEQQLQEPSSESGTLALSVDDFSALEERILRAVELVKRERLSRAAAEERATKAEAELQQQAPLIDQLQKELNALQSEREQVRQRVERLLSQLDALEL
jgi:septal ring factor EnvC (AmiA/AmiB activator)